MTRTARHGLFAAAFALAAIAGPAEAQTLRLTTEEYPPFNYTDTQTRTFTGLATDLVKAVMDRAGVAYRIDPLPWQRAYQAALNQTDTCVFSTTVTEERQPLFRWVGPLVNNDWVLFAAPGSTIAVASLDDARQYRIGGYQGDAVQVFLTQQGFTVDAVAEDRLNVRKLTGGRIDLWATGSQLGPYLAQQEGVEGLRAIHTFRSTEMGLACNPGVDEALIGRLNAALQALRADGTYETIAQAYR